MKRKKNNMSKHEKQFYHSFSFPFALGCHKKVVTPREPGREACQAHLSGLITCRMGHLLEAFIYSHSPETILTSTTHPPPIIHFLPIHPFLSTPSVALLSLPISLSPFSLSSIIHLSFFSSFIFSLYFCIVFIINQTILPLVSFLCFPFILFLLFIIY